MNKEIIDSKDYELEHKPNDLHVDQYHTEHCNVQGASDMVPQPATKTLIKLTLATRA